MVSAPSDWRGALSFSRRAKDWAGGERAREREREGGRKARDNRLRALRAREKEEDLGVGALGLARRARLLVLRRAHRPVALACRRGKG